ncbi:MAG: peptidoglycan DD-metalloendopeptidase family protein [Lewinellaceae bacterium]|nr:peptidoglycan DD-metalloendopeptidase family protein [Lewinellaceae bacterium]
MSLDEIKPQPSQRKFLKSATRNWIIAGITAVGIAFSIAYLQNTSTRQAAALAFAPPSLDALPVTPANMRWGFAIDEFHLFEDELRYGDVLGTLLIKQGVDYTGVQQIVANCKDKFNINSMRVGKKLSYLSTIQGEKPLYMVYEPSPYSYTVFQLTAPYTVEVFKRDVQTEVVSSSGVLETNFWQALTDNGLSYELADGMIDVLSASVDFYHQKQGDKFKVVYEQHYVEGKAVGTGKILAALYERDGQQYYAFSFDNTSDRTQYFDYEGHPARKAFLKAPVKFSRISSRYSMKRMHPILGYNRPHFGTDYAAPYGTPIIAVADGVVEEATRRGGNGNFVKLRHDKSYETQYLHMKGFAKGIRPGARVVQGQTIGYVGSTGLATGPHVCFRFWKNGKQVDHLRLNLPQPEPIKGEDFERFKLEREKQIKMLEQVAYRTRAEIFQENSEETAVKRVKP